MSAVVSSHTVKPGSWAANRATRENPERVFAERGRHMTQQPRLDVAASAVGVDMAGLVVGDGVDGQVATLEILFQRDVRVGAADEIRVSRAGPPLGAGQRVLFAGIGMQEHGEVPTDLAVAAFQQIRGRCTDDHPVLLDGLGGLAAKEPVAHGATDQVRLHANVGCDGVHGEQPPVVESYRGHLTSPDTARVEADQLRMAGLAVERSPMAEVQRLVDAGRIGEPRQVAIRQVRKIALVREIHAPAGVDQAHARQVVGDRSMPRHAGQVGIP